MADPILLNTSRGAYRLALVEQSGAAAGPWVLTLSTEHTGGLEKFAFRCVVSPAYLQKAGINDPSAACIGLARWLEREFEKVRETALKSIRSERRLADIFVEDDPAGRL
jgi:hypothetical protein